MMEWQLFITHNGKKLVLPAIVEYKSKQIIRVRVKGNNSLLLESGYPAIRFTNSKRGVHWKIREGSQNLPAGSASLMLRIFQQLEELIKRDFKLIYPDELL